ncbi:MAG: VOC family protein, partial [Nocardioides kribbensis]
ADEGYALACLEIAGDPQRVSEWLGETVEAPLEDVKVEWVAPHGTPGIIAVQLQTPSGLVRL